ncbi:MAG: DNA repair protein RecO [Oscillospiraceae bacterium]|jgi:DNA repair protein RecO (recombination protein O)|nr:DNA repair protein RecO [Oscillospiraceae bacterium]
MLSTLKGIVIGQRNVGENSRFIDILTEELGVIEITAHATRKINSKNAGSTALFTYSKFCLNKSKSRYSINSAEPIYSFHKLSADFAALSLAAYFADLIKYTSASEQRADGLLRFFAISLYELEKNEQTAHCTKDTSAPANISLIKSVFELKLSQILGLSPDLIACAECFCYEHDEMYFIINEGKLFCGDCFNDAKCGSDTRFVLNPALLRAMRFVIFSPNEKIYKFELGGKNLRELAFITESYLLYHLGRGFKTLDYFKRVT